jgi:hypothetical protein
MPKIAKKLARNPSVFTRILVGNKRKDPEVSTKRSVTSEGVTSEGGPLLLATQITSRHPEGIKYSMLFNFFFYLIIKL